MVNLIKFNANFKFVDLKTNFSLQGELAKTIVIQGVESEYKIFIQKVINIVKTTHFTTADKTCLISLEPDSLRTNSTLPPPFPNFPAPHLIIVARVLYRCYGIKIRQVDAMQSPRKIVVSWLRDHPILNPPSLYTIKSRQEKFLTDCTLKFENLSFPAHRIVLAAKSSYFEAMFKSGCKEAELGATIPILVEDVQEKSIELLLDYFYTGEVNLQGATISQIDNLVNFSSYFTLPCLRQLCFEHLCKVVNVGNLKNCLELAGHYGYENLKSALVEHSQNAITSDDIEQLILLAEKEDVKNVTALCIKAITGQIKKIGYEPEGIERGSSVKEFKRFFDLAVKLKSNEIFDALEWRLICIYKGPENNNRYRLPLEKLIDYLSLAYQSYFGAGKVYPIFHSSLLCEHVVDVFKQKIREKADVRSSLIIEYLELVEKYGEFVNADAFSFRTEKENFSLIKTLCGYAIQIKLFNKIKENPEAQQLLDILKKYLLIAQKYHLTDVNSFCENRLLEKLAIASAAFPNFRDLYNKIFALVNQFNLIRVKEACEKLKQT